MDSQREHRFAVALAILLFGSILLLWVPSRWAASLFQIGAFALAIAWGFRREWSYPALVLAGAVLWGLLQLAAGTTVYRWETWNAVLTWTTQLVCFLLGFQILSTERVRSRFLQALFYFGFALSVVSVVQLYTSGGDIFWLFPSGYKDLVLGPFVYHNQFAAFVEMIFPLALVAALRDRRALLYAGMAAALYASVIASASRAGVVLVSIELLATLAIARVRPIMLAGFAIFGLVFAAVVGWQTLWHRISSEELYATRWELTKASIEMVQDHPLMGSGLGTWPTVYPAYARSDDGLFTNQAHNDWVQWAAEGGVPFFVLMLSIAIWCVRPAVRSLWGIGILAVFAHALADYPVQRASLGGLFWVMAGALAASKCESSRHQTS